MEEKKKSRREWVKTAAIVFLTILLILTFFSNTIMNYSLPEVAAQYVQSGTITAKIRGGGVVESGDPYEVTVKQTRTVASVAVKDGDTVQKGDVLLLLEDEESDELEAAQLALESAQDAYDLALLSADVTAEAVNGSYSNTSVSTYRQRITDAQTAVKAAQNEVDELQESYDELEAEITLVTSSIADIDDEEEALEKAQTDKENADFALTAAKNKLDTITSLYEYANDVSSGDLASLAIQKNEATQTYISAQTAANEAQLAYDMAKTAYDNKVAAEDKTGDIASLKHEQDKVKVNLDEKSRELEEKQQELSDLTADINKTLNLEALYKSIENAREEYDELLAEAVDAVVTANISGTVTTVNAVAGKEVSAAEPVVVLQPEGKGYTMSFSVTNEQAKRLSVGDVADVVNAWRYDDLEIVLSSIKPDTSDPGQSKLLTFDISGEVTAGQTINVSVGQKSATYDCIVPNSAIREDNNGKFVLTVESKSSPLGNRYVATRADVQVIASDDTQSAVSGGLSGYEFVITTSNKPVEAGELVRLSNDN
ncbi:MAG: biotin/lipoyl-binding protein [Lachnospiraceae bacterium]|nr:biotin/lipoyl-binding protein [Lachnospiraceae bacterium]